jgi:hypothetical protein
MSLTVIQGPAIISYGGLALYTESGITVDTKTENVEVTSDDYGVVDNINAGLSATIKCTPLMFSAGVGAALWPYGSTMPGELLCGTSDTPLVIQTRAGQKYTYVRACLSKMPQLRPTLKQALIGEVEFTAFPSLNADLDTDGSFVATTASAWSDTSFDPDAILRGPWTYTLGGSEFEADDDMQVSFELQTEVKSTTQRGPFDLALKGLKVTASFTPVGLGHSGWLAMQKLQGSGNGIGSRGRNRGSTLAVACDGFSLSVPKLVPTASQTNFSASRQLEGQIQLSACRTLTSGALDDLFTVSGS